MKKFFNCLFLMWLSVVLVSGLGESSTVTSMKNINSGKGDYSSPKCTITVSSTVGIGKEGRGMITCTDDNSLKDTDIGVSDIIINQGLIKKVKITKVYNKDIFNDGRSCSFNFKFKGVFFGKAEFKLKQQSISDYSGNANWASNSSYTIVKLF